MGLFDKDILNIFKRYLRGKATSQEKALVDDYYDLYNKLPARTGLSPAEKEDLRLNIYEQISRRTGDPGSRLIWLRYTVAACVVAGLILLFLQYRKDGRKPGKTEIAQKIHPIVPGSPRASIVLADGSRLNITDAPIAIIAGQGQTILRKIQNGLVQYSPAQGQNVQNQSAQTQTADSTAMNTLETPRGGYYQVILADGSHIWLDAASSLRYNAGTADNRTVELTGCAYFEIAPRPGRPFLVHYKGQLLEILGTHFNIDAYSDHAIRTTVLEGKVRVTSTESPKSRSVALSPGEQATLKNRKLIVAKVDTSDVIAWKNNVFAFKNTAIQEALEEASRWYDFDVVYDTDIPERHIVGSLSRNLPFTSFLRIMETTDLHFSMKNDTLHVSK